MKCNCKGNCDRGYCACVKVNNVCDEKCDCPPTCNNMLNISKGDKKRKKYHKTKLLSCNCKNRNCLTKYCICKTREIACTDKCNCCNCDNNKGSTRFYKKRKKTIRKSSKSNNGKILLYLNKSNNNNIAEISNTRDMVELSDLYSDESNNIAEISNTRDMVELSDLYSDEYTNLLKNNNLLTTDISVKIDINLLSDKPLISIEFAEELRNINLFI